MKFPKLVYVYYDEEIDGGEDEVCLSLAEEVVHVPDAGERSDQVAIYVLQEVGTIETVSKFKKSK